MLKTPLFVITTLLLLTSCVNTKGTFVAEEDLLFKRKKLFSGRLKDVPVRAGNYKATLKFKTKKKLKLILNGEDKKIVFKIPEGTRLPSHNGVLNLTASQTGQPYDLYGEVQTDFSRSGQRSERESCSWTTYRRECHRVCEDKDDREPRDRDDIRRDRRRDGDRDGRRRNRNCRRVCEDVPVTHYGYRRVVYHYEYEDKKLFVELMKPASNQMVAAFSGSHHSSNRVVDHSGICR